VDQLQAWQGQRVIDEGKISNYQDQFHKIKSMSASVNYLALDDLNHMNQATFVKTLGHVFEHSPWVATKVWDARPFTSPHELVSAMVRIVEHAPIDQQLALLCAHPELAGKEARAQTLTTASTGEQASAGLNALSKAELALLSQLNADYQAKFGFPFIIAVRNHTKAGIFNALQQRITHTTAKEFANALEQVYAIADLRLKQLLE
jgi:2-oxo-4-hydroxy-4-carboxy-5-ureidoimidazoline decarboxylase